MHRNSCDGIRGLQLGGRHTGSRTRSPQSNAQHHRRSGRHADRHRRRQQNLVDRERCDRSAGEIGQRHRIRRIDRLHPRRRQGRLHGNASGQRIVRPHLCRRLPRFGIPFGELQRPYENQSHPARHADPDGRQLRSCGRSDDLAGGARNDPAHGGRSRIQLRPRSRPRQDDDHGPRPRRRRDRPSGELRRGRAETRRPLLPRSGERQGRSARLQQRIRTDRSGLQRRNGYRQGFVPRLVRLSAVRSGRRRRLHGRRNLRQEQNVHEKRNAGRSADALLHVGPALHLRGRHDRHRGRGDCLRRPGRHVDLRRGRQAGDGLRHARRIHECGRHMDHRCFETEFDANQRQQRIHRTSRIHERYFARQGYDPCTVEGGDPHAQHLEQHFGCCRIAIAGCGKHVVHPRRGRRRSQDGLHQIERRRSDHANRGLHGRRDLSRRPRCFRPGNDRCNDDLPGDRLHRERRYDGLGIRRMRQRRIGRSRHQDPHLLRLGQHDGRRAQGHDHARRSRQRRRDDCRRIAGRRCIQSGPRNRNARRRCECSDRTDAHLRFRSRHTGRQRTGQVQDRGRSRR